MREKICEMVSVMQKAAKVDDEHADLEHQMVTQLQTENTGLKEMLKIHKRLGVNLHVMTSNQSVQTGDSVSGAETEDDEEDDITPESSDIGESELNDSVIDNMLATTVNSSGAIGI